MSGIFRALRPTFRYWMKTEVHVYAFSIAANVLLSFYPFLIVSVAVASKWSSPDLVKAWQPGTQALRTSGSFKAVQTTEGGAGTRYRPLKSMIRSLHRDLKGNQRLIESVV